jgi:triphosphatase
VAAEQLRRGCKKLLKGGKRLDTDPRHRHKLRIQAKKLRYAAEFFAPAFPGKKSVLRRKDFLTSLQQLQDALGELNDIAVNEKLLKQLGDGEHAGAKRHGGRIRKAVVGHLSGREEARIAPLLKQAERAYAAFAKVKPFWA